MFLKVEIPAADAAFRAGYVAKWYVKEGDPVGFGDDLCDIAIDEFVAMQRTKRATLLGSSNPFRKRRVKDAVSLREGRGVTHMRLTSSEGGLHLGKILVPEGGRISIGDVVGFLSGDAVLRRTIERWLHISAYAATEGILPLDEAPSENRAASTVG